MLEHPWMVDMKTKKVNMSHFLKQVWDWTDDPAPAPKPKPKEEPKAEPEAGAAPAKEDTT